MGWASQNAVATEPAWIPSFQTPPCLVGYSLHVLDMRELFGENLTSLECEVVTISEVETKNIYSTCTSLYGTYLVYTHKHRQILDIL